MRWVALLRAVNLGARNKVPMAKLRALLEDAGYGDVRTYIASGNVLLDGPTSRTALARRSSSGSWPDDFGVDTTAIVRKPDELSARSSRPSLRPDTSRDARRLPRQAAHAKAAAARLEEAAGAERVFSPARRLPPVPRRRPGRATLGRPLESLLGVPATHRNWRTVVALAELAAEA